MKKSINKLICTLIATAMIIVMLPMTVFAENIATLAVGESNATAGLSGIDGVAIDETNFPDANFRSYVAENYDYDKDGFLSSNECAGPRGIGIPNSNITSLKGIEYFNELTNLNCSDNKLTSLDVSKNLKLEMLACGNNQLTNLDVSQNSKLASLECKYNQLTSLDVTKNAELQDLNCDNNKLTELDVSQNSKLVFLNCEYNQLTSLDVNNNSQLANLYCSWNPLTALDVTKNRI